MNESAAPVMSRVDVVQTVLGLFAEPRYLEIGVNQGLTFEPLKAARKVAVDPDFRFDLAAARAAAPDTVSYHPVESDAYFAGIDPATEKFDVIFIDGLHLFDQVLRDLLNAIEHLAPGGVIVIDDVLPDSYVATLPDIAETARFRDIIGDTQAKAWMGDVFRLVFFIRDYLPAFRYATVRENHGQMVLWRGRRPLPGAPLPVETIARLEYKHVIFTPEAYDFQPLDRIVARIEADRTTGG